MWGVWNRYQWNGKQPLVFVGNQMKCLTPNCTNQGAVNCKGLCMAKCYPAAKKLVDSGKTTWEALAEMGLAQNKVENAFLKAFEEKSKQ